MNNPTFTHGPFPRGGMLAYVHLIRATDDPERTPRHPRKSRAPHLDLKKSSPRDWHAPLLAALTDGTPRTFNRLGIEMLDLTADILFETPVDRSLWELVAAGAVEHTTSAPILFRIRDRAAAPAARRPLEQLSLFSETTMNDDYTAFEDYDDAERWELDAIHRDEHEDFDDHDDE